MGDQIRHAGTLEQPIELVGLRRAGDHDRESVVDEPLHELADASKRLEVRKVARDEDLGSPLADSLPLGRFFADARHVRHQLVATHADRATYPLVLDLYAR